jgi:hypothetical protein
MENSRLRQAASTAVNVTVAQRSREYLTDREVERLMFVGIASNYFTSPVQICFGTFEIKVFKNGQKFFDCQGSK